MEETMDLGTICYKSNFLTKVIVRVDFVSPLKSIAHELPKELGSAALKHFPIDEPRAKLSRELQFSEDKVAAREQEFTEWNFHGRRREKRLVIGPAAFFVEYDQYQAYEQLRQEFLAISTGLFASLGQAQASRLGLRYINELRLPGPDPLDWRDFVSQRLLGLLTNLVDDATPSRIFHNYEVVFDQFSLRFQFGIHNPDYPAPIRRRVFILDYDAYYRGLIEAADVGQCLDIYHAAIQKMFEQSITDNLREVMNGPAQG